MYDVQSFREQFEQLNKKQQQAVTTIDGPVLVVAGPGTGKTQLLAMRAANIVQTTDTAPSSILCLTFTESAALAMRQRLIELMGVEGNKVAVHTFHSFGTEVINQNVEYFYNGARFAPADDMASYQLLRDIFQELPHSSPLAKTMNGEFTALHDAQIAISHLKRAGLLPNELLNIIEHNKTFYDFAEPLLAPLFAGRLSKKDFPNFTKALAKLGTFKPGELNIGAVKPVAELYLHEFTKAINDAENSDKTTSLTAWRNAWLEKNKQGDFVFKGNAQSKKLKALAGIYEKYRAKLSEAELFDFDDMVSSVAHTLETTPELRFNLQEQYLYIMVDEFQDTNGAQLRLLNALAENPVNEDRPNILAVGDDDQAIYAFQGAELNNVVDFTLRYRDVGVITLVDNYRSTKLILQQARGVITQAETRLESTLQNINKQLAPHNTKPSQVQVHEFTTPEAEHQWVTSAIQKLIAKGQKPSNIAIIARHHKQLIELLPHLHAANITTSYERRNNVLEDLHLQELITMARTIVHISDGQFDQVDELLPRLLSYEFWQLKTSDVWQLSMQAYKERRMWLELMLESTGKLREIAEFLVVQSHDSLHLPLDAILDALIGTNEQQAPDNELAEPAPQNPDGPREKFISPFRSFYFSEKQLNQNPEQYLALLGGLRAIRRAINNYQADTIFLKDFVALVDLYKQTNTAIIDSMRQVSAEGSVSLMTAHKAKGLEFNCVFVLSCQDDIWGRRARHRYSSLRFPQNLPIEPAGTTYDDALRLFYVALTRAKNNLYLTYHTANGDGKPTMLAEFLQTTNLTPTPHAATTSPNLEQLTPGWSWRYLNLPKVKQKTLLQPTLDTYKLSATHINNFVDITRGGPQAFLLQNLLRFPQAMTTSQIFGYTIHAVLQRAHTHLSATGEKRPIEDILHDFELQLQRTHLTDRDIGYLTEKGSDALHAYLGANYANFNPDQIVERNFYGQDVVVGSARLTGVLDLMQVDKTTKTITVTDYKTGKCYGSWRGQTDFDKIKLHKYRQQLMLYKLLVENSREFAGYTVQKGILEFVEPDPDGNLHRLELDFDQQELATFVRLLQAVWQHIQDLNLPDTGDYETTYGGISKFEQDLLAGK